MCQTLYVRETDEEIETPRQLRALLGPALVPPCAEAVEEDCCLCHHDLPGLLAAAGYEFEFDYPGGEYVVAAPRPPHPTPLPVSTAVPCCVPLPLRPRQPPLWRCAWVSGRAQLAVKDLTKAAARAFCAQHGLAFPEPADE